MKKIAGHTALYKNEVGAVVNADWKAYEKAKQRKKEKQRLDNLENRLDRIEQLLERLVNVN